MIRARRAEAGRGGEPIRILNGNANSDVVTDQRMTPASSLIRPYMPELDSMRGIAVLMVLFLHGMAAPLNANLSRLGQTVLSVSQYGGVGVNLFFVLSGFLITGILIANRGRPDYYRRFYARRALRILPALYATLIVLLLGGLVGWRFVMVSLLFLANFAPLLGLPLQYPVLWSLAVEEHFYMLWPAIVRKFSSRCQVVLIIATCAVTPLLRAGIFMFDRTSRDLISLHTWCNLDGLAIGALLAIWVRRPSVRRLHVARLAGPLFVGGASAFLFLITHPGITAASLCTLSINLACAGLLSSMLLLGTGSWSFLVDRPFLKFLGFISYGLYLIHMLAFRLVEILFSRWFQLVIRTGPPTAAMFLRFILGAGLAIGIAYVSRVSLEKRFLLVEFPRSRGPSLDPTIPQ
jgi:peptidoglycan/LPS O-acetylase OafA/YrhL